MKKFNIYLLLLLLITIAACQKQDYEAPVELINTSFLTNVPPGTAFTKSTNEFISFLDLSHGSLTRQWTIETPNKFLITGFNPKDSLFKYIDKSKDTTSNASTIHVLFLKPGINKVKLRLTFNQKVTYPGTVPIVAVEQNGVWVIEKIWEINIYGPLLPAFKVTDKNNVEVLNVSKTQLIAEADSTKWPVVEVEAGDFLNFTDLTTDDRPEGRKWTINGGKPETSGAEVAKISFFKLGTFNAGTITSSRTLPKASTIKVIPLKIKVIPSSKPFVFVGGLAEAPDETISFTVSGEVKPFSGQEGSFTLKYVNGTRSGNIAVLQAKVNATDATKIDLKLAAPIYNSDALNLSFAGTGIKSVDERTLASFTNQKVKSYAGVNIIPDEFAGIETYGANANNAYSNGYFVQGNSGNTNPVFSRTTDKFVSGVASMKFEVPSGITTDYTLQGSYFAANVNMPAGAYSASITVFLEVGNTMSQLLTSLQTPATNILWDISSTPRGQWVTLTQNISIAAKSTGRYDTKVVKTANPNAGTGLQKLYIDDYSFTTIEVRP